MSNTRSRNTILSRLYHASRSQGEGAKEHSQPRSYCVDERDNVQRIKQLMEGMRAQVHVIDKDCWLDVLMQIQKKKVLRTLLYSSETDIGAALENHVKGCDNNEVMLPELIQYKKNIEDFKARLFTIEAAITTSKGAIADTGAIILWPDETEPRLMSLVPPIHIVVLDAETIYNNLSEAMKKEHWQNNMPTNAVLISGPSKTADIELILAFGVHGPKELIVIIRS